MTKSTVGRQRKIAFQRDVYSVERKGVEPSTSALRKHPEISLKSPFSPRIAGILDASSAFARRCEKSLAFPTRCDFAGEGLADIGARLSSTTSHGLPWGGNHEWCFYGWRLGAAHVFLGPNNAVDVWSVKKVNPQSMIHLTEKPVELAARAVRYTSRNTRPS